MPKTRPNRLGMYSDVRKIFDACLASGGGTYELPTYGKAIHWRQRAYKFRKLYAETMGITESSIYDSLVIHAPEPDTGLLRISIRAQEGTFTPASDPVAPIEDDELLALAQNFASKLGKD